MLDKLPVELAAHILRYLDTKSLACAEQVDKAWNALAQDVWGSKDYGPCSITHVAKPTTSRLWRQATRERHRIDRTMRPLLARMEPTVLAHDYNLDGDFEQALVALGRRPPPFPFPVVDWLQEAHTALTGQKRDGECQRVTRALRGVAALDDAISADNDALLRQHWVHFRGPHFEQMMAQASRGQSKCFNLACTLLARSDTSRAKLSAQPNYNPVSFAVRRRNLDMLRTALASQFAITRQEVAAVTAWAPHEEVQGILETAQRPEDLAASMAHVLTAPGIASREERLAALFAAGADVNAPVPYSSPFRRGHVQLPPFLACFELRETPIAPLLRRLLAAGADPHVISEGKNAWHCLGTSYLTDSVAVAHVLRDAHVDINRLSEGEVQSTPLGWAMLGRGAVGRREDILLAFGASLTGTHWIEGNKPHNALGAALRFKNAEMALRALAAGNETPGDALAQAWRWADGRTFTALVRSRRWQKRQLDSTVVKLLTMNRRTWRAGEFERMDLLASLAQAGASVNIVGKPFHIGAGVKSRMNRAQRVAPGLWPTAALAIAVAYNEPAMPYLQRLQTMGVDLHARGPEGVNAWHALTVMEPRDSVAVAKFLAQEGVDVLAKVEGTNGEIAPLDAMNSHKPECPLRPAIEAAVAEQVNKRPRGETE